MQAREGAQVAVVPAGAQLVVVAPAQLVVAAGVLLLVVVGPYLLLVVAGAALLVVLGAGGGGAAGLLLYGVKERGVGDECHPLPPHY